MNKEPLKKPEVQHSPFLGAAYYPEAWAEKEQEHDIALMKEAGIKVVRLAEFAWYKMEPREGEYHFEWLHNSISKLSEAGIAVILGTPTATPPQWVEEKDPDMMQLDETGIRAQHGARRNNCSNNPTYRKYAAKIVEKMAQEFGQDPHVIGWQVDNEIYSYGNGCFCEHCKKSFALYLKKKYATIEHLNSCWNLHLFSQAYDDFKQVPMPKSVIWHGPHIKFEWKEFIADSHVDFIKMQVAILRKYTTAPIGTDMMPLYGVDYEKIAPFVDIMQFNHYDDENNLMNAAFWFDYLRTFKDIPFWVTETSTCWNGATDTPLNLRPEGFCRANSWLPFVLGGGANLYWLWRQHWAGHELMHGAVLYASGRPMHIFQELQQTADELKKAASFLSDTKVVTDTALMVSGKSHRLLECQHITDAVFTDGYGDNTIYKYINNYGIRPDVISPYKDISHYKLLFTPYMLTLEEADLQNRIEQWVKDGGIWIVGPLTDIRNSIGAHYTDRETGFLESLIGCELVQQIPDNEHRIQCKWSSGKEYKACHFLQLFDIKDDAESWVTVSKGFSSLVGKSVVLRKQVGKGSVIVLGALPVQDDANRLLDVVVEMAGAEVIRHSQNIIAAPRKGTEYNGIACQEIGGRNGHIEFRGVMTDLLTGKVYANNVELEPFQTMILSEEK